MWGQLKEGFDYAWGFAPVRTLLLLMALLSLVGMPALTVLMPIFADALGGPGRGSQTLGLLMGASGAGALAGAVYLASRRSVLGLGRMIAMASLVFGGSIVAFAFSKHLALSLPIIACIGFGMLMNFASANTLLQTLVDDDKRGRVMSFFSMAFVGMTPFGNLLAGALASRLGPGTAGASRTLMVCGSVCLAAGLVFAGLLPGLRKLVVPVYVEKGILPPQLAAGIESGTEVVADGSR